MNKCNMKGQHTLGIVAIIALMTLIGYFITTRPRIEQFQQQPELRQWWSKGISKQATNEVLVEQPTRGRTECASDPGLLPDEKALEAMSDADLRVTYRDYASNMEVICKVMLRMGNVGDGGWEVCNDQHVRPPKDCLVYSFGINNDFSFDDMTGQHYGCEIHAFDPSMKMQDTKRSEKVMFHHLGVSGKNGVIHNNWPVKTIMEIKKTLGHSGRRLDILKMDIEGSEWPTLTTALQDGSLKNVTQFLFEIHNFGDDRASLLSKLKVLRKIRELGFRIFFAHKNEHCSLGAKTEKPLRTACHEIHAIHIPACALH